MLSSLVGCRLSAVGCRCCCECWRERLGAELKQNVGKWPWIDSTWTQDRNRLLFTGPMRRVSQRKELEPTRTGQKLAFEKNENPARIVKKKKQRVGCRCLCLCLCRERSRCQNPGNPAQKKKHKNKRVRAGLQGKHSGRASIGSRPGPGRVRDWVGSGSR